MVVEHFDLIYPLLGGNANILIGVGEQVLVARPTIFGPEPEEIKKEVDKSLHYWLMAHSAEDICEMFINKFDLERCGHDDVRHTGQIEDFRLMNHLMFDKFKRRYLLVGCVGEKSDEPLNKLDIQSQQPGWM